jgi:glycosyltransferase involved in cell wall biosynthesis
MKIGILGTRGIPNNYGGFEECAEHISRYFVNKGHDVTVFCPDYHPYPSENWEGVRLKKIFSREPRIGPIGNLIYEYLSIKNALKNDFDIILELGTEYALFSSFYRKGKARIITNVDGLETRRDKWSPLIKHIIRLSEKNAIRESDAIVADNPEIKQHVDELYSISSHYIGYGATARDPDTDTTLELRHISEYDVQAHSYCLLIARLERENNIEMIIDGYLASKIEMPLLIIGPTNKKYGKYLVQKYRRSRNLRFIGGVYSKKQSLDALRHYAYIYFHGHSVGGTNPALLQAMAQGSLIFAHNNVFNRYVLKENAFFFNTSQDLGELIDGFDEEKRKPFSIENYKRLETEFHWKKISIAYLMLFECALTGSTSSQVKPQEENSAKLMTNEPDNR